jgi:aminocarboxymuconate-semialdehyde decarboxylase
VKIDVHNHAFPERVVELLRREPAFGFTFEGGAVIAPGYVPHELYRSLTDPASKILELEAGGLEGAVVCAEPSLFLYEVGVDLALELSATVNAGLAEFCTHFPDRLRWMAHVPLQEPGQAQHVLDEAVRNGAVGVEIGSAVASRRPDEPDFDVFWAAAERLGLPVFVHPAYNRPNGDLSTYYLQNVIGNPLETTIFIERMICSGVLERHPRLQLILAHAGGFFPYQVGRLRHARTVRVELESAPADPWSYVRRQVYIDCISHDQQALKYLVSCAGPDRVVMGTDFPYDMATVSPMRALLAAVSADEARQIAEDNPRQLFLQM